MDSQSTSKINFKAVALWICVLISGLIAIGMPFPNEDLFLAFCSGREILAGNLFAPNQWSYTVPEKIWVDQSWLSHLIYYLSFRYLEFSGPVWIKVFLLAASLIIIYKRCRALSISPDIALVALILGTLSFAPFLKIRAENFGMFYFIVLTGFLSLPNIRKRFRQAGSVILLSLWSNSHGSFPLGLFAIAVRSGYEIGYHYKCRREQSATAKGSPRTILGAKAISATNMSRSRSSGNRFPNESADTFGWSATAVLAVLITLFSSPYGVQNLILPFNQLFSDTALESWIDWRPLLNWPTLFGGGWFKPLAVRPFLIFMGIVIFLILVLLLTEGGKNNVLSILKQGAPSQQAAEFLMPLLLLPLVFRHQRMILYAAPAFIPILAVLMNQFIEIKKTREGKTGSFFAKRSIKGIQSSLLILFFCILSFILLKGIIVRYLPNNPLNWDRNSHSPVERFMSYDLMRPEVVHFIQNNKVSGKLFVDVHLSNYLLFNSPEIRLFFDLRAQSFYPDEIIKIYMSLEIDDSQIHRHLSDVLIHHGTDFIVLDLTKRTSTLSAHHFMETMQWGCIFANGKTIILKNIPLGEIDGMHQIYTDNFRYESPSTKIAAQAYQDFFLRGGLDHRMLEKIFETQNAFPNPHLYELVVKNAQKNRGSCMDDSMRSRLLSDIKMLASQNPLKSGGSFSILLSQLILLRALNQDEVRCGSAQQADIYRRHLNEVAASLKKNYKEYGGF